MFKIKICGITRPEDVAASVEAGADAIGLNFFSGSRRYVDPERAMNLCRSVPRETSVVGVFVNADAVEIVSLANECELDLIQCHGEETPEQLAALAPLRVIRAFRIDQHGLGDVFEYLQACVDLGCAPHAVLLDAYRAGERGGTGTKFDWSIIGAWNASSWAPRMPLILAGGLTPTNVESAIRLTRPAAVDTASGVESAPGIKDPKKIGAFVSAAKTAFAGRSAGLERPGS